MSVRSLKLVGIAVLTSLLVSQAVVRAQEQAPAAEPPPLPKGIEVLARGPVHEAFAAPATEPAPTTPVPKRPPKPLEEMPPQEKPEGQVIWIGGYWAWDDERNDFLWVSGIWRTPPPHKQWIAGYWREQGEQWHWVAGFWAEAAAEEEAKQVTYLPQPPQAPQVAPPGQAPTTGTFYVPGSWSWNPNTGAYAWRAGYWARIQPGYIWVPDRYLWTPAGYVFVPGYWDLTVSQRGVLYAPVIVDPLLVPAGYYYTPAYAVTDTVVIEALFVRPVYAHYYFGDYYGPAYVRMGYESAFVYSGRHYDSIIVYESWAHRSQPNWVSLQIDVFNGRSRGVLPVPPRTLVQQNTIIQQNTTNVANVANNITNINNTTNVNRTNNYTTPVLASTSKVMAAKGVKTVPLDEATRVQAKHQAAVVQQVAMQRTATERPLPPGTPRQAHVASLSVPKTQAVQPGFVAPRVTSQAMNRAQSSQPLRPATVPSMGLSATAPHSVAGPSGIPSSMAHPGTPGVTNAAHTLPQAQAGQPQRGQPSVSPFRPASRPSAPPASKPPPKEKSHH
jgi:hypothetical protein